MIEVWVDIEGIPFYQVSNKGNFRSITREITVTSTRQRPYKKIINGTSVKPFKCKSTGYLQIKVYGKKYSAHRIVAKAFCTGFCDGLVVNHKNGQIHSERNSGQHKSRNTDIVHYKNHRTWPTVADQKAAR